jgi:glutamate racemase
VKTKIKKQYDKPIGIFDSGLGGLTVFKRIHKLMPAENLIYFGDTAHVPYGTKSPQTVQKYSLAIAKFLETKNIKILVVACNSASAAALKILKKQIKIPVIDVIAPGVEEALKATKNCRIAVIGTKATIKSKAYLKKIKSLNKKVKVYQKPCPLLCLWLKKGFGTTKLRRQPQKNI